MEEKTTRVFDNDKIRREVTRGKYGSVFFASSFRGANAEYASKLLSSFEKEGLLVRISQGVYLKARKTRFGISYPPIEEIVVQIAKRDRAKILPTGATAANMLGLSDQVPMKTCFLTSGTARRLNLGGRTVELKRAAPKNFAYNNEVVGILVQALRSIGAENVTEDMCAKIRTIMKEVPKDKGLDEDLSLAPAWIGKLICGQMEL